MATQVEQDIRSVVQKESSQPRPPARLLRRGSLITAALLIGGLSTATIGFVESDRGVKQEANALTDKILTAHMTLPREEVAEAVIKLQKESMDNMRFREIFFPGMLFGGAFITAFGVLRVIKIF